MIPRLISELDRRWAPRFSAAAPLVARAALVVLFIWFGALKIVGRSPAADLVAATVPFVPRSVLVPLLGAWEVAIGLLFVFRATGWWALALMAPQMAGTFLPIVLLPGRCFTAAPFALTLEGQYIVKNLALIALAIVVLGARARPGAMGRARDSGA